MVTQHLHDFVPEAVTGSISSHLGTACHARRPTSAQSQMTLYHFYASLVLHINIRVIQHAF